MPHERVGQLQLAIPLQVFVMKIDFSRLLIFLVKNYSELPFASSAFIALEA
jgi:hypothetical protein